MPNMNVIEMFFEETGNVNSADVSIQGVREETITVWFNRPTGAVPTAGEIALEGKPDESALDYADIAVFDLTAMDGRSDHFTGQALPIMRVIIRNKGGASPLSAWIIE